MKALIQSFKNLFKKGMQFAQETFIKLTALSKPSQVKGTILDLTRSKAALIAENALLRQQLLVVNRQVKQPHFKPLDRFLMVVLASLFSWWRQALLIVKPDTLIRWHRQGFRLFWKLNQNQKALNLKLLKKQ